MYCRCVLFHQYHTLEKSIRLTSITIFVLISLIKVLIVLILQVTMLLFNFSEEESRESEERNTITGEINTYNRRFSGEPRPVSHLIHTFQFNAILLGILACQQALGTNQSVSRKTPFQTGKTKVSMKNLLNCDFFSGGGGYNQIFS